MRLQYKVQGYQSDAVASVVDCFAGDLLTSIRAVQERAGLPLSDVLATSPAGPINLDVEMETGTGKTYVYIKTILELRRRYGWSKFVVVVPSIAIREGVKKTFDSTAEHFAETYGTRPRAFVYDSQRLHELEGFASDPGVQVMIINIQAFNATGKDNRRIYEELDDFGSRRPIDVIAACRPVVVVDEPQRIGAEKSLEALSRLNPLAVLRYSATHKVTHDLVHRLDAVDAYQQRLVKRIAVRGITVAGLPVSAHVYVDEIETAPGKRPRARVELEVAVGSRARREFRYVELGTRLGDVTRVDAYRDLVVTDVDAVRNVIELSNGDVLVAGQVTSDVAEDALRRIQIREVIRAHLAKERELFERGIKVLSLFFIDEVANYRDYDREDTLGEYARVFEEEYAHAVAALEVSGAYAAHLGAIDVRDTHAGYFSIDRKTGRQVDPDVKRSGEEKGQSTDVAAYDLILRDKERLLSFEEPVRFLFSHSALREGWDNPNVFVMGMLKRSDSTVSRRQEVGRGLRLAVNQRGERIDDPAIVHQVNELTVVTDESYTSFVDGLQKEIAATLRDGDRRELPVASNGRARVIEPEVVAAPPAPYVPVSFDSDELVANAVAALDAKLRVDVLQYVVQGARQDGDSYVSTDSDVVDGTVAASDVTYDLVGEISERTRLTRRTVTRILTGISPEVFGGFRVNPPQFIERSADLITAERDALIAADRAL